MTRLAIAGEPGFELSLADAPKPAPNPADARTSAAGTTPNYTIDTLERLRTTLAPDSALFCLMGADSFFGLPRWHRAAELPFVAPLIVASRPGQPLQDLEGDEPSANRPFAGVRAGEEPERIRHGSAHVCPRESGRRPHAVLRAAGSPCGDQRVRNPRADSRGIPAAWRQACRPGAEGRARIHRATRALPFVDQSPRRPSFPRSPRLSAQGAEELGPPFFLLVLLGPLRALSLPYLAVPRTAATMKIGERPTRMKLSPAQKQTRALVQVAAAVCEDKKALDTRILALDPADSGLSDFFLVTSASNERQAVAIADEIELRLKREFGVLSEFGRRPPPWRVDSARLCGFCRARVSVGAPRLLRHRAAAQVGAPAHAGRVRRGAEESSSKRRRAPRGPRLPSKRAPHRPSPQPSPSPQPKQRNRQSARQRQRSQRRKLRRAGKPRQRKRKRQSPPRKRPGAHAERRRDRPVAQTGRLHHRKKNGDPISGPHLCFLKPGLSLEGVAQHRNGADARSGRGRAGRIASS